MGAVNLFDGTPLDERMLSCVAYVIGEHSAAAQALAEAERRRASGEAVAIYRGRGKDRGALFVGPVLPVRPV